MLESAPSDRTWLGNLVVTLDKQGAAHIDIHTADGEDKEAVRDMVATWLLGTLRGLLTEELE